MLIEQIRLVNWQSYYGAGASAVTVSLRRKANGLSNVIVYGQNTRGKTALWEALRFALYGRVPKRMSKLETKSFKPVVAADSAKEPLLNVSAFEEGRWTVGVELWFDVLGVKYFLDRKYQKRPNVDVPKSDGDMTMTVTLKNETTGTFESDPTAFLSARLPEELARFFMFDGERLEEYRELLQKRDDVELRASIEAILRLPVLRDGTADFQVLKTENGKQLARFRKDLSGDKALRLAISRLEQDIEDNTTVLDGFRTERDAAKAEVDETKAWLRDNDQSKAAVEQVERYEQLAQRATDDIRKEHVAIKEFLPDVWRTILTPKLDEGVAGIDTDLMRQAAEEKEQVALEMQLAVLARQLAGDPCMECGTARLPPSSQVQAGLQAKQQEILRRVDVIKETKVTPNPGEMQARLRSLQRTRREANLEPLVSSEMAILRAKKEKRDAEAKAQKARDLLSADARREVASKVAQQDEATKKVGLLEAEVERLEKTINGLQSDLNTKLSGLKSDGVKTPAHRRAEIAENLLDALITVWESALETHRESMRAEVERVATDVFLTCSNNAQNYKRLAISNDFTISIINKSDKPDLGSPGQWAVIAYSMLDALTRCAGIEFPMVIDTPGRSIDDEHLQNIFEHFFQSGRQVILLPEGKELAPDVGDKNFGHLCAATYCLNKNDRDHTEVVVRVNNLAR
jgi:DNA sulfur modification protein DndD